MTLRGMATVSYFADDLMAAKQWYTELLGIEPYFVRPVEGPPAYIEFRIGDLCALLDFRIDRIYTMLKTWEAFNRDRNAMFRERWHLLNLSIGNQKRPGWSAREFQLQV